MGRDKALVEFGGRPLVAHVVDRFSSISDDVFVVAKATTRLEALGVRVYRDDSHVRTPLAGILTALRAAAYPLVFVCATDMPHISHEVVALLASRAGSVDAVVPQRGGRLEPLCAVWSTSAACTIADRVGAGERAVHRVLDALTVVTVDELEWRAVDPEGASFTNLNTPDELEAARR